jgi:hypothetical protein
MFNHLLLFVHCGTTDVGKRGKEIKILAQPGKTIWRPRQQDNPPFDGGWIRQDPWNLLNLYDGFDENSIFFSQTMFCFYGMAGVLPWLFPGMMFLK